MKITFGNNTPKNTKPLSGQNVSPEKKSQNAQNHYEVRKDDLKKAALVGVLTGIIGFAIAIKEKSINKFWRTLEGFATGFFVSELLLILFNKPKTEPEKQLKTSNG